MAFSKRNNGLPKKLKVHELREGKKGIAASTFNRLALLTPWDLTRRDLHSSIAEVSVSFPQTPPPSKEKTPGFASQRKVPVHYCSAPTWPPSAVPSLWFQSLVAHLHAVHDLRQLQKGILIHERVPGILAPNVAQVPRIQGAHTETDSHGPVFTRGEGPPGPSGWVAAGCFPF